LTPSQLASSLRVDKGNKSKALEDFIMLQKNLDQKTDFYIDGAWRSPLEAKTIEVINPCLYPNNGRMLREAKAKGFHNALVTDVLGNVAETATSNVFMVRGGEVYTPVPNGTFLNGITRQRVIGLLRQAGVSVHETTLTLQDFREADEIFSTGNISKVVPIIGFDERALEYGAITKRARALYWEWAHS